MVTYQEYDYYTKCPYTENNRHIIITYAKFPPSRNMTSSYKKMEYACPLTKECPYAKQDDNECPVFLSAPDKPQ